MKPIVQSYTSWQPLEEIIIGRVHTPDYFDFLPQGKIKSQLCQVLQETNEDLDRLQKTIEQYGAIVRRPELPNIEHFQHWQMTDFQGVPIPPLTPRDWQITLGEKLLRILHVPEFDSICQEYQNIDQDCVIDPHGEHPGLFDDQHPLNNAVASCIVRVGTDVFFDNSEFLTTAQMEWIQHNVLDKRFRVRRAQTNGHGDAVFAILKPGVIISSMHDADINYRESFPGWEICKVWDSTIHAALAMGKFKYENFNDRWYVTGQDPAPEFCDFVDTYLTKWTGFVKETVFDVNCLVLDEHNVIFSSYNKTVFDFCKKHKIEPIICEQRHKYFFDSGISCCTQDIRRRGALETYL